MENVFKDDLFWTNLTGGIPDRLAVRKDYLTVNYRAFVLK
jgi:hypothetical protein